MKPRLRLITRIGLFAALYYVLSYAFVSIPNISPGFFVVFAAGFLWGVTPGLLVGAVGMSLWTGFNPHGPATIPVSLAQILGMSLVGLLGGLVTMANWQKWSKFHRHAVLAICGVVAAITFFLPVNLIDAWVYQPFWPRFYAGSLVSVWAAGFNGVVFPLMFGVVQRVFDRERMLR